VSEDSKKYRSEMRTKAYKLANQKDERVDASDWRREGFDATDKKPVDVKEAPLSKVGKGPCNPRAFKNGGAVARKNGGKTARVARAMGGPNMPMTGAALGNSVVPNSVVPQRGAVSGSTFLKSGGRVARMDGGGMGNPGRKRMYPGYSTAELESSLASGKHAPGSDAHTKMSQEIAARKSGASQPFVVPQLQGGAPKTKVGRMANGGKAKAKGGEVPGNTEVTGTRPTGGRLARASGGKAGKGKMNVNIIIAQKPDSAMGGGQPPMPMPAKPPMAPPPGAQIGGPGMPAGGAPQMPPGGGNMPPPSMMRKRGGKVPGYPIEDGAGGGEGRLEKIKAYG